MVLAAVLLIAAATSLLWAYRPGRVPTVAGIAIRTAGEAEILAERPADVTVFRFAPNPKILVLDFASPRTQGMMLDRIAALTEKAGLPRDRVLAWPQLEAVIRQGGDTIATYYDGHDYRAADIVRFFALAAQEHLPLSPEEERLRALMRALGWTAPDAAGALISIPGPGTGARLDERARATMLRHELSHGAYFTEPAYAAWVRRFWHAVLTPAERGAFRRFLGREGYDTGAEDLMANEAQAYLMHTADPRYFTAAALGVPEAEMSAMRRAFRAGMPRDWLYDSMTAPGG